MNFQGHVRPKTSEVNFQSEVYDDLQLYEISHHTIGMLHYLLFFCHLK